MALDQQWAALCDGSARRREQIREQVERVSRLREQVEAKLAGGGASPDRRPRDRSLRELRSVLESKDTTLEDLRAAAAEMPDRFDESEEIAEAERQAKLKAEASLKAQEDSHEQKLKEMEKLQRARLVALATDGEEQQEAQKASSFFKILGRMMVGMSASSLQQGVAEWRFNMFRALVAKKDKALKKKKKEMAAAQEEFEAAKKQIKNKCMSDMLALEKSNEAEQDALREEIAKLRA